MAAISSVLHRQYEPPHYAGNGVLRAMSQMKPASSRAMAASTRGWGVDRTWGSSSVIWPVLR